MSATNWAWACDWFQAPMIPKPMLTPPFCMKPGMIVCSGRLRPASVFGRPGASVKRLPRLCRTNPQPFGVNPDPNPW